MTQNLVIKYSEMTDKDFPIPRYQTIGSSGLDLRAYLPNEERDNGRLLLPKGRSLIYCGVKFQIPAGFEGQIRARSGLSLKYGVALANGVGTIDSDYRGDLGVVLINFGTEPFIVKHCMRIAQLVVSSYARVTIKIAENLLATSRDDSGFGSTGEF